MIMKHGVEVIRIKVFELSVLVEKADWDYLCKYRFFTNKPSEEQIECEFVTGTGITPNKKELLVSDIATKYFADYIKELKEVQSLDINTMARELLRDEAHKRLEN